MSLLSSILGILGLWSSDVDDSKEELAKTREKNIKNDSTEHRIYQIGTENVSYSLMNPNQIEYIGSKRVEYNLSGNIVKIGDELVTTSMDGKLLTVGDKTVTYSGNKIASIGNDTVYYK